jgi:hypothetical protein
VAAATRATIHACKTALRRLNGDLRTDAEASRYPSWPNAETDTLSGLFRSWVADRTPKKDTERLFKLAVEKFEAFLQHEDVAKISSDDVRRWCAHLRTIEKKGSTRVKNGYLAALKAVFNCAVEHGAIKSSPCANVIVKETATSRTREKDLEDGEVYAILRASLQSHMLASESVAAARRWVPWIMGVVRRHHSAETGG